MKIYKLKNKKQIATLCFLTDIGLALWSYLKFKNYDEYLKIIASVIDSPELQVQIYTIFLQVFIFSLLVFLLLHTIIYIHFVKEYKYANTYVRFYTFTAALSGIFMILSHIIIGIAPLAFYGMAFISSKKSTSQNLE